MREKPGSADVHVGMGVMDADEDVGVGGGRGDADEDVGGPGEEDVGEPRGREWYSRGYLPHRDRPHLIQSVTYRLADSMPQVKLKTLRQELARLPEKKRDVESRKRIERWLDAGMGCCALKHPEVASYVQDSFLHFHGVKYVLHAWCIMPNHVHVLVEPFTDLATIVQGWKSFTARWILKQNERLGLRIPEGNHLWMREYWDRFIRDAGHYYKTVEYFHQNPVKAGLCQRGEDWLWSSCRWGGGEDADEDVGEPGGEEDVGGPGGEGTK